MGWHGAAITNGHHPYCVSNTLSPTLGAGRVVSLKALSSLSPDPSLKGPQ